MESGAEYLDLSINEAPVPFQHKLVKLIYAVDLINN